MRAAAAIALSRVPQRRNGEEKLGKAIERKSDTLYWVVLVRLILLRIGSTGFYYVLLLLGTSTLREHVSVKEKS